MLGTVPMQIYLIHTSCSEADNTRCKKQTCGNILVHRSLALRSFMSPRPRRLKQSIYRLFQFILDAFNPRSIEINVRRCSKVSLCPQDEKYWTRRHKNNEAAKRSRDARRLKENQISVRASYLERENAALRQEVAEIRKELGRCRSILSKYENRLPDQ